MKSSIEDLNTSRPYPKGEVLFPLMTMEQKNNVTYKKTLDSSLTENHASIMIEINVYSNKESGASVECEKILGVADTEMQRLGFLRTFYSPIPNMDDSVARLTARYDGVVSKSKIVYKT
nr:MAG TPA: hypothetical protein [Caudoviricetes sp.]